MTKKQIVTLIKRHKLMPVLYDLDRGRGGNDTIGLLMSIAKYNSRPIKAIIKLLEIQRDYKYYRQEKRQHYDRP